LIGVRWAENLSAFLHSVNSCTWCQKIEARFADHRLTVTEAESQSPLMVWQMVSIAIMMSRWRSAEDDGSIAMSMNAMTVSGMSRLARAPLLLVVSWNCEQNID
jgi:hypothetical protein